jgi:hypothetical protein
MKIKFLKQSVLVGVAMLGLASAVPIVAQAMPAHAEEAQTTTQEKEVTEPTSSTESEKSTSQANSTEDQKTSTTKSETETENENSKDASQTRLADTKLKACENRQQAITNIMARLNDRGQKQIDLFSTIAERTEAFYKSKGNTLANYDALVVDVATNKAAAQAAVDATKSVSGTFKCDGTNPKGVVSAFKTDLKAEIAALNNYRTSVKNLIVGVKSVQGTTSSSNGGAN